MAIRILGAILPYSFYGFVIKSVYKEFKTVRIFYVTNKMTN